jgi:hypothetical protein
MADLPPHSDAGDEADAGGAPSHASTPRWIKVIGISVMVLVVLVVILLLTGGEFGRHGPGLHTP